MTVRLLIAMVLGATVALLGGMFLGEYEFDEWLPILSGVLLGLIVAEIVVSIGRHRSLALGMVVASWCVIAVLLAGIRAAAPGESPMWGAYLSAVLSGVVALARASEWGISLRPRPRTEQGR